MTTNTQAPRRRRRRSPPRWPVVLLALALAFAAGYATGARSAAKTPEPPQASPEPAAPSPTVTAPVEVTPEPVRWRDDIVTDGNLLAYDFQVFMQDTAEEYGVPYALLLAIADVESRFDPDAASATNDYGLMQINQCNHEWLREEGMDPLTYEGNIEAGAYIISQHLEQYGDTEKALMAYNCGATGARRLWDAGVFETDYSRKVMAAFEHWTAVLEE